MADQNPGGLMGGFSLPEPTGSGDPKDLLKQLSSGAVKEITNFAMGMASGVLKGLGMSGAKLLPSGTDGGNPSAMLGSTVGSFMPSGQGSGSGSADPASSMASLMKVFQNLLGSSGGGSGKGKSSQGGSGLDPAAVGADLDLAKAGDGVSAKGSLTMGADLNPDHYVKEDGSIDDQKAVETTATVGATLVATSLGIPPPASTMVGKAVGGAVGNAYAKAKESLDEVNPQEASSNVMDTLKAVTSEIGEAMNGGSEGAGDQNSASAQDEKTGDDVAEALMQIFDRTIGAVVEGAGKLMTLASGPEGAMMSMGGGGGASMGGSMGGGKSFTPGGNSAMSSPGGSLKPPGGGGGPKPIPDAEEGGVAKNKMSASKPRPPKRENT